MRKAIIILFCILPLNLSVAELNFKIDTNALFAYYRSQIIDEIKYFEGFKNKPYKDSKGFETIGYGCTNYNSLDSISEKEAENLLIANLIQDYMSSKDHFKLDSEIKHLATGYIIYCFGLNRVIKEKFIIENDLDTAKFIKFCYHSGKFNQRMLQQRKNQIRYFYTIFPTSGR